MTELEKAVRMAMEALRHGVSQLNGIGIPMEADPLHTAITALTQALATTEPDFDGSVIVGHSKHRGGWFVFEEVAEGEFTPIKGPFSSKDEADQAMRAPRAPLIQPAPTERKGEPVYQICMADSVSISTAWVDVGKEAYDDAGLYPEYRRRTLYTSPQVPEDVIVILDECRTALMECDRDCDYELIDRAYAAIDAARKGGSR